MNKQNVNKRKRNYVLLEEDELRLINGRDDNHWNERANYKLICLNILWRQVLGVYWYPLLPCSFAIANITRLKPDIIRLDLIYMLKIQLLGFIYKKLKN